MSVRAATEKDRAPLLALMRDYCVFYETDPPAGLDAVITMALAGEEAHQFVAEDGAGELAGFATLYFPWSTLSAARSCLMNDLFVAPAARGSGAAAELLTACRDYAREHGYRELEWQTANDNHRAQAFYNRMGGTVGPWLSYSLPASAPR